MRDDILCERADHDRVTKIGPHPGRFLKNFLHPVFEADTFKLDAEIGYHATGDLVLKMELVIFQRFSYRFIFAFGDVGKTFGRLFNCCQVEIDLVIATAAILHKKLCRRMRGAIGQR